VTQEAPPRILTPTGVPAAVERPARIVRWFHPSRVATTLAVVAVAFAFVGVNLCMGAAEKESADAPYTASQRREGAIGAGLALFASPTLLGA
jgi:hypothetical protein